MEKQPCNKDVRTATVRGHTVPHVLGVILPLGTLDWVAEARPSSQGSQDDEHMARAALVTV